MILEYKSLSWCNNTYIAEREGMHNCSLCFYQVRETFLNTAGINMTIFENLVL